MGGAKIDPIDYTNNFVEVMDTITGTITKVSDQLLPTSSVGLAGTCLIGLPEEDAFVVTGGQVYNFRG